MSIAMKEDVYNLQDGQVVLRWPDNLNEEGYRDLVSHVGTTLRTVGRKLGLTVRGIGVEPIFLDSTRLQSVTDSAELTVRVEKL